MKKTLIITTVALATTLGMTLNASAQESKFDPANCPTANCLAPDCPMANGKKGKRGGGHGYHRNGGRMMNELNLTDAQKAQIDDIMVQHREETHVKIRAILTPEQQAIFDARKQQRDAWFDQR
ncbi:MAG: hypothetical protein LBE32_03375 [Burkholderiales bacterium]|jgi:Spy/CpxP family protein refolding chaperone|nr:hypothetical protein [Burkholderiales bacterium]